MSLSDLGRRLGFLSNLEQLPADQQQLLERVLADELLRREQKRVAFMMKRSGIKRIKLLADFDWSFNPKLPREKLMQFHNTRWLTEPANLMLIGPAGVGKTHLATALCHDALSKGYQTLFMSLFDMTAKIARARNAYNLIEFYARVPVLCIDALTSWAMSSRLASRLTRCSRSSPAAPRSTPRSSPPTSSPHSGARSSTPPPPRSSSTVSVTTARSSPSKVAPIEVENSSPIGDANHVPRPLRGIGVSRRRGLTKGVVCQNCYPKGATTARFGSLASAANNSWRRIRRSYRKT